MLSGDQTETDQNLTISSSMKREGKTKITFEEKEVTLVMIKYDLPSFAYIQTKSQPNMWLQKQSYD